jgi:hypothetical protein
MLLLRLVRATFAVGGGLAGPVIKAEVTADLENGISD